MMSNWRSDKATFNQFENAKIIGYEFICRSQAAGTNDKKWGCFECYPDMMARFTGIYWHPDYDAPYGYRDIPYNYIAQAANIRHQYTPEQQEMIDWLNYMQKELNKDSDYDGYGINEIDIDTYRDKYIEIINKHRSK